jgi:hypothetical protein
VFWRPVLGYALAGLLLIANVLQPVPPEVRTLGDESLGSVRLAGPQPIAVSESSETSSLEIPLEPGSKSSRFRIQLSNATRTRELVDERTPDEPGDVLILALAPGWLKADRYEISVDELEPRQRRVGSFQIVVEP